MGFTPRSHAYDDSAVLCSVSFLGDDGEGVVDERDGERDTREECEKNSFYLILFGQVVVF